MALEFMAALPGFSSRGRSLHLGTGCHQWELLDVSGTQPPLSDAVVKCSLMQFNRVNVKEHQRFLEVSDFFCICACVGIPCALRLRRSCVCFERKLAAL